MDEKQAAAAAKSSTESAQSTGWALLKNELYDVYLLNKQTKHWLNSLRLRVLIRHLFMSDSHEDCWVI